MTDEQAGTGQVLQCIAAFVAAELVAAVAGKTQVAEDDLGVGTDLRTLELGDAGGVGHQYAGIVGQGGGTGIGQAVALLAGFIYQNATGPGSVAEQARSAEQHDRRAAPSVQRFHQTLLVTEALYRLGQLPAGIDAQYEAE